MRKITFVGFIAALALGAVVVPGVASAKTAGWNAQANSVCTVWLAKAQKLFATPVKPAGLYKFAVSARALESQELAVLKKIPNASTAGTHALGVMRADIAEVSSAIGAADRGDSASFVRILKQYLNDHRIKAAFTAAGATRCG